tara:strand:- start:2002 stop:2766 length:765 start_codon:yes stop_codon:yes gene_type:complete
MAIDLDAIRNRLNRLQNKVQKTDNLWKPKPGKQQIRMLPYNHNESNPFIELFFHYDFGGKNILSPKSFGEADPIIQFADQLRDTGNRDDWNLSKKLFPKMRTYVPVIVRGEESEGVKFWGFGKTVYQELLAFFADPDYGDLTDFTNGRDITVEFKTAKELGKNYPETYIRVKPNQTVATDDSKVIELIKDQIELPTLFKKYSYSELETLLKNWLETGKVADDSVEETQPTVETTSNTTSTVSSVKDSFEDLFNS